MNVSTNLLMAALLGVVLTTTGCATSAPPTATASVAASVATPAAEAAQPAPVEPGDAALVQKIRASFAADELLRGATDLKVSSTGNGQITLTGTVPSVAAFRKAIELARASGAQQLNNKLMVAP